MYPSDLLWRTQTAMNSDLNVLISSSTSSSTHLRWLRQQNQQQQQYESTAPIHNGCRADVTIRVRNSRIATILQHLSIERKDLHILCFESMNQGPQTLPISLECSPTRRIIQSTSARLAMLTLFISPHLPSAMLTNRMDQAPTALATSGRTRGSLCSKCFKQTCVTLDTRLEFVPPSAQSS